VRADILVKGPRLEEAVRLFVDLVLTDMEEVRGGGGVMEEGSRWLWAVKE
jgi:hypothetical protein